MKYILFVKQQCPFCVKAQSLLEEKNLEHNVINFEDSQRDTLQEIKNAYEWATVPMIFCRSGSMTEFVGGYTDLVKFLETNE